jgi:hypothetical protein
VHERLIFFRDVSSVLNFEHHNYFFRNKDEATLSFVNNKIITKDGTIEEGRAVSKSPH